MKEEQEYFEEEVIGLGLGLEGLLVFVESKLLVGQAWLLVHLLGVRLGLVEWLHSIERVKEDLESHLVEFVSLVGEQFVVVVEEWMVADFLEFHPFGSICSSRRPLSLILVQPWQAE